MDFSRYEEVLKVCGLKEDLSRMANSDQTVLGEKGDNLSGG